MEEVKETTIYIGNKNKQIEVSADDKGVFISSTWNTHAQGHVAISICQLDNLITALNAVRNVKNNNERKQT